VLPAAVTVVSLSDRFGRDRALGETSELITAVVTEHLMAAS